MYDLFCCHLHVYYLFIFRWILSFWCCFIYCVVVATAPRYRSKTTSIWLEEAATTVDFILDPEVTPEGHLLRSVCECDCGSSSTEGFVDFVRRAHFELSLVLVVSLIFLCFLLQRRIRSNLSKRRQFVGSKRPVTVWILFFEFVVKLSYIFWENKIGPFFLSLELWDLNPCLLCYIFLSTVEYLATYSLVVLCTLLSNCSVARLLICK